MYGQSYYSIFDFSFYQNMFPFHLASIAFLIVMLIVIALLAVIYVFCSIGLFTIAKRRGIRNYGLAWVPIGNAWIIGRLADQYDDYVKGKNMRLASCCLSFSIAWMVLYFAAAILSLAGQYAAGSIVGLFAALILTVYSVFLYIAYYKIFHAASPDSAGIWTVLSVILGVVFIAVFALRKRDEGFRRIYEYRQLKQRLAALEAAEGKDVSSREGLQAQPEKEE